MTETEIIAELKYMASFPISAEDRDWGDDQWADANQYEGYGAGVHDCQVVLAKKLISLLDTDKEFALKAAQLILNVSIDDGYVISYLER